MHNLAFTATAGLLALAASTQASSSSHYVVGNYCEHNVSLTLSTHDDAGQHWSDPIILEPGHAHPGMIAGEGASVGITRFSADYWDAMGPKMVFATSTNNVDLYWNLNSQVGNPFAADEPFSLRSFCSSTPCACGTADGYSPQTHSCKDDHAILELDLCSPPKPVIGPPRAME